MTNSTERAVPEYDILVNGSTCKELNSEEWKILGDGLNDLSQKLGLRFMISYFHINGEMPKEMREQIVLEVPIKPSTD